MNEQEKWDAALAALNFKHDSGKDECEIHKVKITYNLPCHLCENAKYQAREYFRILAFAGHTNAQMIHIILLLEDIADKPIPTINTRALASMIHNPTRYGID